MEMRHTALKRLRPKVEIARASRRRACLCFGGKPCARAFHFKPCRGVEVETREGFSREEVQKNRG